MEPATNIPRSNKIGEDGKLINPLPYYNDGSNRRSRRESYHSKGGSKSHLYVFPSGKYKTVLQRVFNKEQGMMITIKHAIVKGNIGR